jgi:CRISPR-associated protein Csm1
MGSVEQMSDSPASYQTALQVAQAAIQYLATWAGVDLGQECAEDSAAIDHAKKLLPWNFDGDFKPLRVLFDQIKLDKGNKKDHYWDAIAIENNSDSDAIESNPDSETLYPKIPYPQTEEPSLDELKGKIKSALEQLLRSDSSNLSFWNNLSLVTLILEKYGSFISLDGSNVAFFDLVRATAAIAAALTENSEAEYLSLVAGDLSGIQDFIYTISSDGALKSLRARSFYLELVTEEIVQQLLEELSLPRSSVIYAGGGNLYLLAPVDGTAERVQEIQRRFNHWLLENFQGKVFLALDLLLVKVEAIATQEFAKAWEELVKQLAKQKNRKFANQLDKALTIRKSYEACKVCHRDDTNDLQPLNPLEPDSPSACGTCRTMFALGDKLPDLKAIVRSSRPSEIYLTIPILNSYYYLYPDWTTETKRKGENEVLLINDWNIRNYTRDRVRPLLLGNYFQRSPENQKHFIQAEDLAKIAQGIDRVGYLRMDVDRLGQIFAKGLGNHHSIATLSGLSRQMSYFFKVYLNSLASDRQKNTQSIEMTKLTQDPRPNLMFIYAGGDDLFVSGAWNEVVEFAFDVYQSFRAYTGHHPDITISGGISLASAKYPLYQAAEDAGEVEGAAKSNGRDSLGLFNAALKWDEWLGYWNLDALKDDDRAYLTTVDKPALFGVFPFVECLYPEVRKDYTRSFVRNLLNTAKVQEEKIKEAKQKYPDQVRDIQYYLHLPKIAYTLARLPERIRDAPNFQPVRTSLKSPYNAPYFRAIATWIELLNRNS